MPELTVTFPCFFRIETSSAGRRHDGRVLLAPHLASSGARPEDATHRLADIVRNAAAGDTALARRLSAVPEDAEVTTATFTVPWKGRRIDVPLRLLRFDLGGQTFTAFPRIGAVVAVRAGLERGPRHDATQVALDRWFRAHTREVEGDEEPWSDRRGDRILWLDARIRTAWTGLEEEDGASLLQALFGQAKVTGAEELPKVSRRLDQLYPDRLLLDAVPDPRVDALRTLIFEDDHPVPTVLVGPSGSGKTTLVHAAIRRHLDHVYATEPKQVQGLPRLHHLDPNRVIAGMSRVGAWERRLVAILEHLVDPQRGRKRDGLFVDQPLALARVGRSAGSTLTLTTVLRPWVEDRRFPLLLEATAEAWVRLEEMDRAFTDLFHVERVDEPPWERAMLQVLSRIEDVERGSGATLTIAGVRRLVELQARFPTSRGLPGGLIDRLQLLAARNPGVEVLPATVEATFQGLTGLRPEIVDPTRPVPDEPLRARIGERLIGQPRVAEALAELVHVLHAGLARPGRPLAAWLLVGPTGVGKTEAAKVLSGLLFTSPEHLVRLDMNEYGDGGAVSRLLGEGGVEGHLPARLRRHAVAVLLLDEIEKAHPAVHDLLLQLLDEGRITDGNGRVLDLSRVAVLLTSNVGAAEVARGAGFGRGEGSREASFRAAVERTFRPELVNRLDRILVFEALSLPDIRRVAALQIDRVLAREGFLRRTVLLDLAPGALDALAEAGFDPDLGARALKRVLEARLVSGVAERLASVPLDQPLVLEVRAHGADIALTVRLLHFAPQTFTPRALPVATEVEVRALLDSLPAAAFRLEIDAAGTRVEGGHVLRLKSQLEALLATFGEEVEGVDITDRAVAGLANRSRRFRGRGKARWRPDPIDWYRVASFRSVREFLLDGDAPAREWDGDDHEAVQFAHLRADARALGRPSEAFELYFEGVVADAPGLWRLARRYMSGLSRAVLGLGGDLVVRHRRPDGGWEDGEGEGPTIWRLEGPGLSERLAWEEGIHLFYPEEGVPVGLRVRRERAEDTVVRLYPEYGEARDLATGLVSDDVADLVQTIWAQRSEP